jgi:glycine/D-amino acid oxidase-like deaminating enzyme
MGWRKRTVICGGGAIGAAIAYFMSRRGARPIVIERHEVAGAASGKSGGFLALDWCRGSPLDRLARRSFELLAEEMESRLVRGGQIDVAEHAQLTSTMVRVAQRSLDRVPRDISSPSLADILREGQP